MTRDEAIKILRAMWKYEECGYSEQGIREALTTAIKALEQQPCKDCVSRSDVIVLIEDINLKHLSSLFASGISQKAFKDLLNGAQALPSVIPTHKKGHWIDGHCSECGGEPYFSKSIYNYKFCPYCGERMSEVENG